MRPLITVHRKPSATGGRTSDRYAAEHAWLEFNVPPNAQVLAAVPKSGTVIDREAVTSAAFAKRMFQVKGLETPH